MNQDPSPEDTALWQKRLAAKANNRAWSLADQASRTAGEDQEMLQAAHAAMYFWKIVGNESNRAHAAQLVAHVYAQLKQLEPAKHYLSQCQPFFLDSPCATWELAYAHLVAAGVAAADFDSAGHSKHYQIARSTIDLLSDQEERDILNASLRMIPVPKT
jgi:hypothetical protein